jgi:hypothetical protein
MTDNYHQINENQNIYAAPVQDPNYPVQNQPYDMNNQPYGGNNPPYEGWQNNVPPQPAPFQSAYNQDPYL